MIWGDAFDEQGRVKALRDAIQFYKNRSRQLNKDNKPKEAKHFSPSATGSGCYWSLQGKKPFRK